MKKRHYYILPVLIVLLLCSLPLLAAAEMAPSMAPDILDAAQLLNAEEELQITAALQQAERMSGVDFYVATYKVPDGKSSKIYRYEGETFMAAYGLSSREDWALLVITLDGDTYYYDQYYYGNVWDRINEKERNYILDHDQVYDNIKSGALGAGVCAYLDLTAQGYVGRVGVPYSVVFAVSLLIAVVIGVLCCVGVYSSYQAKHRSVDYPLDRFAKLNLTSHDDAFVGSFITKRVISSGNNGRGGTSHGGGSGHAGGR